MWCVIILSINRVRSKQWGYKKVIFALVDIEDISIFAQSLFGLAVACEALNADSSAVTSS